MGKVGHPKAAVSKSCEDLTVAIHRRRAYLILRVWRAIRKSPTNLVPGIAPISKHSFARPPLHPVGWGAWGAVTFNTEPRQIALIDNTRYS